MGTAPTDDELLRQLVNRLGGENTVLEQLSAMLERDGADNGASAGVTENTAGYCYLKLFDAIEHRDARALGPYPKVAELRRFSNSRAAPFGHRTVAGRVHEKEGRRVCHVEYDGSRNGLRAVALLAALSKDCEVGGIPDGPSSSFPPGWIPAKFEAYQCWDYVSGTGKRPLDFLSWVGELRDVYETVSAPSSRIRWIVSASPVGPDTATIDVVPPNGKTMAVKRWESDVAHTGHHQMWGVRGTRVFVEAYVWRAARFTTTPGAPLPTPPSGGGHRELLQPDQAIKVLTDSGGCEWGRCYEPSLADGYSKVAEAAGLNPTVDDLLRLLAMEKNERGSTGCAFNDGYVLRHVEGSQYHVERGDGTGRELLAALTAAGPFARVGATQAEAVKAAEIENVSKPAQLALRPKETGLVIAIPFAAKVTVDTPVLYWDLTSGKKLAGLLAYFESAELVSLSIKATVHKGDGDTIFHLVADTETDPFKNEMDWIGAAHTLHVSGNSQGATTGELTLQGNHGFGTQLKGAAVGNPTPVLQGWLETSVVANVLIKAVLKVKVAGTGNPRAVVLPCRRAVGNMVNIIEDDDSDDDDDGQLAASSSPSGKHVGR